MVGGHLSDEGVMCGKERASASGAGRAGRSTHDGLYQKQGSVMVKEKAALAWSQTEYAASESRTIALR